MRRLIDNGNRPITPKPHIGHYGRLRKAYLEQYRYRLYTALVASEKLYPHLAETDRAARDICSSEKGLYVNMPATQDKGGNWKDVCWPVTAEFRKQLNDALIDGYGQAIENLQATLEATKGAAEKPSLTGALKENAGKVKEQPAKPATSKNEQAR